MYIASIESEPLPRYVKGELKVGTWGVEVHLTEEEIKASGDPSGFVKHQISKHLAGCVASTDIPLREGLWTITVSKQAQKLFNLPERFLA